MVVSAFYKHLQDDCHEFVTCISTFYRRVSQMHDIQFNYSAHNIVEHLRSIAASTTELFFKKVYVWWKHIPLDTTRTANMDLDSKDQRYHDKHSTISDFLCLTLAFMLKWKLIHPVSDRVDCTFLCLGSIVDSFCHRAVTINWLVKTMPSTIVTCYIKGTIYLILVNIKFFNMGG